MATIDKNASAAFSRAIAPQWLAPATDDRGLASMRSPGSATAFGRYIREFWRLRHFVRAYAFGRLRASRADMLLGSIWLVLEPMLSVATYYLVFEVLLNRTGGVTNFIGFLAVGQMFFANHRRGVTRTASSLKRSEQMLRSFTFPHLVFPVADAIDGFLSFLFMLPVVIVLLVATGETVSLLWILVIPLAAIQLVQTLGVGLLLARFFTRVPDLQVVLENLFRALLFLSGVFWSIDRFTDGENGDLLLRIFSLNPVYCFLEVGRWILMDDRPEPVSWILVSLVVWTVVAASAGLFVFFRGEKHHSGSYRVAKLDS